MVHRATGRALDAFRAACAGRPAARLAERSAGTSQATASPTRALRAKVREMVGTAMCTGYLRLFAGSTSMAESAAAKAGLIGVGVGGRPKRRQEQA